jgi:hypothetical protein
LFTFKFAGQIVVVGPAFTMVTAVSSGMIVAFLLVRGPLSAWSWLVFLLHHSHVYFCGELIRWREMITMNAIIVFANRDAK